MKGTRRCEQWQTRNDLDRKRNHRIVRRGTIRQSAMATFGSHLKIASPTILQTQNSATTPKRRLTRWSTDTGTAGEAHTWGGATGSDSAESADLGLGPLEDTDHEYPISPHRPCSSLSP